MSTHSWTIFSWDSVSTWTAWFTLSNKSQGHPMKASPVKICQEKGQAWAFLEQYSKNFEQQLTWESISNFTFYKRMILILKIYYFPIAHACLFYIKTNRKQIGTFSPFGPGLPGPPLSPGIPCRPGVPAEPGGPGGPAGP